MRTNTNRLWIWALAMLGFLWMNAQSIQAGHPLADKWKVTVLNAADETTVWLIQVEEKDGKLTGKVLSAGLPNFDQTKIEKIQATEKGVHMTMSLQGNPLYLSAYFPKDDKKAKKLLGSVLVPFGGEPIWLERTDAAKIDPKTAEKKGPGSEEIETLKKTELLKERIGILKAVAKKYPEAAVALQANLLLMNYGVEDANADELKKYAEAAMKVATPYGPELEMATLKDIAALMLTSKKGKDLALGFAQEAQKRVSPEMPTSERQSMLRVLLATLKQAGKKDEVQKVKTEIAKLDVFLDEEFAKNAVPFEVTKFKGRKGDSKRVVVVELFTGAQCPPCVAADVAFDAMLKSYKPADVVFLQYHLHIPGPDPMTNKESEKRSDDYNVDSTPNLLINGKKGPLVGGPKGLADKRYDEVRKVLDEKLEEKAEADLNLKIKRMGDTIDLEADVANLKNPGKKVKLRFVVLEDLVRYPGGNKQRLHHHVVRGFPGGLEGVALTEKSGTYKQTLDLKKLKIALLDYLEEANKTTPFLDEARPLELQNLKIVALIQNDETKEILNAVQVNVPLE